MATDKEYAAALGVSVEMYRDVKAGIAEKQNPSTVLLNNMAAEIKNFERRYNHLKAYTNGEVINSGIAWLDLAADTAVMRDPHKPFDLSAYDPSNQFKSLSASLPKELKDVRDSLILFNRDYLGGKHEVSPAMKTTIQCDKEHGCKIVSPSVPDVRTDGALTRKL